jgi:hypothetical protein
MDRERTRHVPQVPARATAWRVRARRPPTLRSLGTVRASSRARTRFRAASRHRTWHGHGHLNLTADNRFRRASARRHDRLFFRSWVPAGGGDGPGKNPGCSSGARVRASRDAARAASWRVRARRAPTLRSVGTMRARSRARTRFRAASRHRTWHGHGRLNQTAATSASVARPHAAMTVCSSEAGYPPVAGMDRARTFVVRADPQCDSRAGRLSGCGSGSPIPRSAAARQARVRLGKGRGRGEKDVAKGNGRSRQP